MQELFADPLLPALVVSVFALHLVNGGCAAPSASRTVYDTLRAAADKHPQVLLLVSRTQFSFLPAAAAPFPPMHNFHSFVSISTVWFVSLADKVSFLAASAHCSSTLSKARSKWRWV